MKLVAKGTSIDPSLFERLTHHSLRGALDLHVIAETSLDSALLSRELDMRLESDHELQNILHRSGDSGALKHALSHVRLSPALEFRLTVMMRQRPALFEHTSPGSHHHHGNRGALSAASRSIRRGPAWCLVP